MECETDLKRVLTVYVILNSDPFLSISNLNLKMTDDRGGVNHSAKHTDLISGFIDRIYNKRNDTGALSSSFGVYFLPWNAEHKPPFGTNSYPEIHI